MYTFENCDVDFREIMNYSTILSEPFSIEESSLFTKKVDIFSINLTKQYMFFR